VQAAAFFGYFFQLLEKSDKICGSLAAFREILASLQTEQNIEA